METITITKTLYRFEELPENIQQEIIDNAIRYENYSQYVWDAYYQEYIDLLRDYEGIKLYDASYDSFAYVDAEKFDVHEFVKDVYEQKKYYNKGRDKYRVSKIFKQRAYLHHAFDEVYKCIENGTIYLMDDNGLSGLFTRLLNVLEKDYHEELYNTDGFACYADGDLYEENGRKWVY